VREELGGPDETLDPETEAAEMTSEKESPIGAEDAFPDDAEHPDEGGEVEVDFAQSDVDLSEIKPPPLKRVQVSNQMDILAELENLRKAATMDLGSLRSNGVPEVDLDSLLAGELQRSQELRRKVDHAINSDVFERMRGVQVAVRIQDSSGDTIYTLDPVALAVKNASALEKLSLLFTFNLENKK